MANNSIIIRPLLTEKTTKLVENATLNQYTFVVDVKANKIEIKQAIEAQFGVTVLAVNTSIRPGKHKSRIVKGRMTKGRKAPLKKAFITLQPGQVIDGFYGDVKVEEETPTTEANA